MDDSLVIRAPVPSREHTPRRGFPGTGPPRSACGLAPHVDALAYARHDFVIAVADFRLEPVEMLAAFSRRLADRLEARVVDIDPGMPGAATGLHELDLGGLVPDDVIATQALHDEDHPERIGHREQAAAEMGADVVAVVPTLAQLHLRMPPVVADGTNVDAAEQEWRPEV